MRIATVSTNDTAMKKKISLRFAYILFALMMLFLMIRTAYSQTDPAPKNIFILISDGWGINHIRATNYWHGIDSSSYQKFPVQYFMSTYQGIQAFAEDNPPLESYRTGYNSTFAWTDTNYIKKDYTGSAPAATAMASGVKSATWAIGVDIFGNDVELITETATELGKSAGVVTSVEWSHATPAGFSTHNTNRNNYPEIALTMLLESRLSVIMGCGHPLYDDNSNRKSSDFNYNYVGSEDAWDTLAYGISGTFSDTSLNGRTKPMDIDGDAISDPWTLIQDSIDFVNLMTAASPPKRLLGTAKCATTLNQKRLIANDTLPYQAVYNDSVPLLYQMTLAAINTLKENASGFVLMVEGGAVDWANHDNQKHRMIEEQQDFNIMVDSIVSWVEKNGGWEENLVIVTGDHECGYLTGPGYDKDNIIDGYAVVDNGKDIMPGMKYNSLFHTGMLIPLYAKGAGSELFHLYADEIDYNFGYYIDNTEIGLVCNDLLRPDPLPNPKNVIYMISGGMGFNHLLAANLFDGVNVQSFQQQLGDEDFLFAAMSTYPGKTDSLLNSDTVTNYNAWYNSQLAWTDSTFVTTGYSDSAPAATSMYTGKKTAKWAIGVDYQRNDLHSVTDRALQIGKSAGVVSTVPFSHATPAAFAAHNTNRNNYEEIANEMLIDSRLSVLIGCGAPDFDNNGQPIEPVNYSYVGGAATWNDLNQGNTIFSTATIHGNQSVQDVNGDGKPDVWILIRDSIEFVNMASGPTPLRLAGIPKTMTTLNQERTRTENPEAFEIPFNNNVPALSEMTKAALNVLDNNRNGFVLMIEGGAIDWAAHDNQLERVIEEQYEFNTAVETVINWVNENSDWKSTLLIITGDHECGYLTGPDYLNSNLIEGYPVADNGAGNLPEGVFLSTSHTNQLIPFYAHGAGADIMIPYTKRHDYVYGRYINNTEPAQAVLKMWKDLPDREPDLDPSDIITNIKTDFSKNTSRNDEIQVYPNPVKDRINIILPKSVDADIKIYNIQGSLVNSFIVNGSTSIDMSDATDGIYIIKIDAGQTTYSASFVKQQ